MARAGEGRAGQWLGCREMRRPLSSLDRRSLALFALTLGVFLVTLNVTVVVVALPSLQADLHIRTDEAAWVIDAYNLVGASLLLSAGLPRRSLRPQAAARASATRSSRSARSRASLAPSGGSLIAFRVLMAVGGTALTPTSLSIVANLYPEPRERARAIGLWGISSGIGTGLGPIVGGSLTDWLGWRSVFGANAIVGRDRTGDRAARRAALAQRDPAPHRRRRPGARDRLPGAADVRADRGAALRLGSPRIVAVAALAVALFVAFIVVELRVDEPLIDLGFFRDRQFAGAIFLGAGDVLHLRRVHLLQRALPAGRARLLGARRGVPQPAGGRARASRGPISGYLVGTRGPRGVLVGGMLVLAAGVGSLALLAEDAAIGWLLASYLVVGFGYAVLSAPVSTVAVSSMPRDQAGVAAGLASAARNVGIVLGIAVLGAIVNGRVPVVLTPASGVSDAALTAFRDAYVDALHIAYAVAAAVVVVGAAVAALTMRPTPPGTSAEPAHSETIGV